MGRRILAIILLVLAVSIAVITPVLAFTPVGAHLLNSFANATPTPTPWPTPVPFTPTPTPPPKPILTVEGILPTIHAKAAYLLDADTAHTLDDFHGEIPLPMASTTKIMTAVIAIPMGKPYQVYTLKQESPPEMGKKK